MDTLRFCKAHPGAIVPKKATAGSAGYDLHACVLSGDPVVIHPGNAVRIPTGVIVGIPSGYEGQVRPRSGLAAKCGVTVLNAPGTIDSDYRGEIVVILINHGKYSVVINAGDRIAQLVVAPLAKLDVEEVTEDQLGATERGTGGFGSTGV